MTPRRFSKGKQELVNRHNVQYSKVGFQISTNLIKLKRVPSSISGNIAIYT